MFRCKECQTEYEIKPDYCDCGNDTFDEIVEKKEEKNTNTKKNTEKTEPVKIEKTEVKKVEQIKKENIVVEEPKTEQIFQQKDETVKTNTTHIKQEKPKNIDNYALLIFLICIILSLVVIFYPVKQTTEQNSAEQKVETKQNETIPDIESFWNGEIAKNISTEKKEPQKEQTIDTQEVEQIKKTDVQPTQQTQTKTKKEVKQTKTTNQNKNQTTKNTANATKTTQPVKQNIQKQTQTKTETANPQEIARYKVRLRNYIASKIDFARVVGDGSCSFSFRVTSNGTLIDKKAGYISDNDSLNEVVYNALRQTPSFNAPPTGYNTNSVLKLYVKMQNGAFEVSLN